MMKKQYIILAAATLLTLGGCKKELETGIPVTFDVDMERPMAKVHLDSHLRPNWDNTDEIHINDGHGTVTPLDNPTRGRFTATIDSCVDGPYYAVFPEEIAQGKDLTKVAQRTVTLPRVQIYKDPNGVQQIDAPMAAYNSGVTKNLLFRNLCGLMQIVVRNDKAWDMILDSVQVVTSKKSIRNNLTIYSIEGDQPYLAAKDLVTGAGDTVISLARANDQSIGTFVKSSLWGSGNTTCTVYVYLPQIAESNNKFTIRVFSHPVWDNVPDPEVHIVYTRRQTSETASGNILRSKMITVRDTLSKSEPTFTSMKAFTADANDASHRICFARGHVQYDCATGRKRFAPRQWAFLQKTSEYNYTSWIEHFCWATGDDFSYHTSNSANHNNGGNHLYNSSDKPTSADWGTHFNNYYIGTQTPSASIWRTPQRYELKDIFFPDYPYDGIEIVSGHLIPYVAAPQDTSKRFAWVKITDVPDVTDPNSTTYLYCIVAFPDDVIATTTFTESTDNNRISTDFHTDNAAIALHLNQFFLRVNSKKEYTDNALTRSQFEYFEAKGCILFPCFGVFDDYGNPNDSWNSSIGVTDGPEGTYWSSTMNTNLQVHTLKVKTGNGDASTYVYPGSDSYSDRRCCVRLVCDYGTPYKYDIDQM